MMNEQEKVLDYLKSKASEYEKKYNESIKHGLQEQAKTEFEISGYFADTFWFASDAMRKENELIKKLNSKNQ